MPGMKKLGEEGFFPHRKTGAKSYFACHFLNNYKSLILISFYCILILQVLVVTPHTIPLQLGSVAGSVIQANGRLNFEADLRSRGLLYFIAQ